MTITNLVTKGFVFRVEHFASGVSLCSDASFNKEADNNYSVQLILEISFFSAQGNRKAVVSNNIPSLALTRTKNTALQKTPS